MLISFFVMNLYLLSTINNNSKAIKQGKRFTYDDGIAIHSLCSVGSFTEEDINTLYGDKETDYKQFLLDSIN